MPADQPGGDPIAEEAERAREAPDKSLLPSNDGLGPGAGETPAATVRSGSAAAEHDTPATSTPSLGVPPHRERRPDFRSSQLDGASEEKDGG